MKIDLYCWIGLHDVCLLTRRALPCRCECHVAGPCRNGNHRDCAVATCTCADVNARHDHSHNAMPAAGAS